MAYLTIDINYLDADWDPKLHPHAEKGEHGGQFVKKGTSPDIGRVHKGLPLGAPQSFNIKIHKAATAPGDDISKKLTEIKKIAASNTHPGAASYANKTIAALEKQNNVPAGSFGKAVSKQGAEKTSPSETSKEVKPKEEPAAPENKTFSAENLTKPHGNAAGIQVKMYDLAKKALASDPKFVGAFVTSIKDKIVGPFSSAYAEKLIIELEKATGMKLSEPTTAPVTQAPPKPTSNKIVSKNTVAQKELARHAAAFDSSKNEGELSQHVPSATTAFWDKVPGKQRSAVKHYTGGGYSAINNVLRNPETAEDNPDAVKEIDSIDALFEHEDAKVKQDIIVRRGMNATPLQLKKIIASISHGLPARFDQQGFISTSTASGFQGDVKLHVLIKKGTPALSVKPVSYHHTENEVLLRHGQSFLALAYEKIGYEHHLTVATI